MPRKPGKVPSYGRHKASGRAVVRLDGTDHYLGAYGTPESHEEYERLIAEWRIRREEVKLTSPASSNGSVEQCELTVNRLILRYWQFAEGYYVKDDNPTHELSDMRYALRPVRRLYGRTLARDFGPLSLKAVRQYMIDGENLSRGVINNRINRIKRVFKWAVSEELVPSGSYEALRAVAGLRFGRTTARETEPVRPAAKVWVDAILSYVSPQVSAMIQVQWLAGMRPGEVVLMRACDIDMSGDIWIYEPHDHKNRWRGHQRLIPLGPRAQAVIKSFLKLDTTAYIFSPRDADRVKNEERRRNRKTPMTPSQANRKPKTHSKRAKRERYDTSSYHRAITYGIKMANRHRDVDFQVPDWCPLQIRHSRATEIRKRYGIEAAQVTLGHARADVTQVYAERNLEAAVRIAQELG